VFVGHAWAEGLRVIDITNPNLPSEIGFLEEVWAWDLAVSGNYIYIANLAIGLLVIDATDPANPMQVGVCDVPEPGWAWSIAVSGDYAYVGDDWGSLRVMDITNPTLPTEVGLCETRGVPEGVTVSMGFAFIANYHSGLQVINVSNPASPVEAGYYESPDTEHTSRVAVSGSYAYVANSANLDIYDCSDAIGLPTVVTGLTIARDGNDVLLSWNDDANPYYRIYSSTDPTPPFPTWEGTTDQPSFRIVNGLSSNRQFYYVVGSLIE
jgi:hypothetical protein